MPDVLGTTFKRDVVVIGGCGHVGLPLAIAFASRGLRVTVFDVSASAVEAVGRGELPFAEPGAAPLLSAALASGHLVASTDPAVVRDAQNVVVVIGTPVDDHLNPDLGAVQRALTVVADELCDGQLLVLRSTVYPGITAQVERLIADMAKHIDVAFCPERIAEGRAMTELFELPQIVGARTDRSRERASTLFRSLASEIVDLAPEEAELAKLFTNVYRYITFAAANQFYMIANDYGLDYERIRSALAHGYPRAQGLPSAGFAAGPCLFKDTMQLAAFNDNNFHLGHSAMLVNEGLPMYVVSRLERRFDLAPMTVGILGMAFKGGSDDTRASLSYKIKKLLAFKARAVLCTDPYVTSDPSLVSLDEVIEKSDLLVVATPHAEYGGLAVRVPVADLWGVVDGTVAL